MLDTIKPIVITEPHNAIALLLRMQRQSDLIARRSRYRNVYGALAQMRYDCACWRTLSPQLKAIARVAVRLREDVPHGA